MPDNMNLAGPADGPAGAPLMFPRMALYLRAHLDTSRRPKKPITARVSFPGLDDISLGEVGSEIIEKAYADSISKNHPFVGLIFKSVFSPLQLRQSGLAVAYIEIDGQDIACALLNITILSPTTALPSPA
ncbi:hypothetical protein [Bradyrhizobium cenepequi]